MPKDKEPGSKTALTRINPQALLQSAIDNDRGIDTLERLLVLQREVRADEAKEAWHHNMAEFQKECPSIKKTASANIAGKYRYTYAPLGEIMSVILPIMTAKGLSVSYRGRSDKTHVYQTCRISHEYGHHEDSGETAMPVSTGGEGANAMQRVGIAKSYAKRYALLDLLGLAPEDDPDAHGTETTVQQPQRASAPQTDEAAEWSGMILKVTKKTGQKDGKPWTLFTIKGEDDSLFSTFKEEHAQFAKDAGSSVVTIQYEQYGQYKNLSDIGPYAGDE